MSIKAAVIGLEAHLCTCRGSDLETLKSAFGEGGVSSGVEDPECRYKYQNTLFSVKAVRMPIQCVIQTVTLVWWEMPSQTTQTTTIPHTTGVTVFCQTKPDLNAWGCSCG